jgi:hypothetical protein
VFPGARGGNAFFDFSTWGLNLDFVRVRFGYLQDTTARIIDRGHEILVGHQRLAGHERLRPVRLLAPKRYRLENAPRELVEREDAIGVIA